MEKSRIIAEIDLRRMEEQLERHLDRLYGKRSNCHNEEWELDPKKLKVNNLIGQGAYGSVCTKVFMMENKSPVYSMQFKILCLSDEKRRGVVRKAFMEEVSLWYNLDHPNITKLIGASKRVVKPESTNGKGSMKKWVNEVSSHNPWARNRSLAKQSFEYCMVVEYVSGGTLRSHLLKNNFKKLPFKFVIQLALDIARGLSYLHSLKIVHRDVKTQNLTIDKERRVKIIDFGISRIESTAQTGTLGFDFGVSCPIEMTAQTGTPVTWLLRWCSCWKPSTHHKLHKRVVFA